MSKHILILGGGYGGLLTALTARKHFSEQEATITVINKIPSHQIVTELHRLAVGGLDERNVALPLSKLLKGKSVNLVIDSVQSIDLKQKQVKLAGGSTTSYDNLVIALGSETAFFGIPGLQEYSMTLKSVEDANRIRAHVEARLDAYAKSKNPADANIVIGGGGLSGIELIGELVDKLPKVCAEKGVDFNDISLYCVEAAPSILAGFAPDLVERAKISLENRGVKFLIGVALPKFKAAKFCLKTVLPSKPIHWFGLAA